MAADDGEETVTAVTTDAVLLMLYVCVCVCFCVRVCVHESCACFRARVSTMRDCVCVCKCKHVCVCACVSLCRSRGALPKAGADDHGHLRGVVGGRHRLRGGLLQNQVRATIGRI